MRRLAALLPVLGLAVLLALFAFETGMHSVHHLGERPPVPCAVASASAHVSGVTTTVVEVVTPAPAAERAAERAPVSPLALRPICVHEGRAPPSAPAA
ncbi:MAG TPA: hypothetical protein VFL90_09515 [Methylomirabilota bacterium]|nr:hypothetical protein [Methylomirabilota bacterium]